MGEILESRDILIFVLQNLAFVINREKLQHRKLKGNDINTYKIENIVNFLLRAVNKGLDKAVGNLILHSLSSSTCTITNPSVTKTTNPSSLETPKLREYDNFKHGYQRGDTMGDKQSEFVSRAI